MFSMSSELSQRMDESFTLLISANWKEWDQSLFCHNNREGFKKFILVVFYFCVFIIHPSPILITAWWLNDG